MSMSAFAHGTTAAGAGDQINITNRYVGGFVITPGTAQAGFRVTRAGQAQTQSNNGTWTLITGQWHEAPTATIGDGYETRLSSGTLSGWPASWTAISATRTGAISRGAVGLTETIGTIAIRKIGDTGAGHAAVITLHVEVDSGL